MFEQRMSDLRPWVRFALISHNIETMPLSSDSSNFERKGIKEGHASREFYHYHSHLIHIQQYSKTATLNNHIMTSYYIETARMATKPPGPPKIVTFSSRIEYIPRSPSSGSESEDSTLRLSQSPVFMPQQKPISSRHVVEQSVPMRTPEPSNTLSYPSSMPRRKAVPAKQTDPMKTQQPLVPPKSVVFSSHLEPFSEIQAAQDRIREFVGSKRYRQFMADQRLVEYFSRTHIGIPECQSNADENSVGNVILSPDIGLTSAVGLSSMMSNEELEVVQPSKSYTSTMPRLHGLRRGKSNLPPPPKLRQKISLRSELQKALPTSTSSRQSKVQQPIPNPTVDSRGHQEKNLGPDDWYPPRKYRSRHWKTADQLVNGYNAATRGDSIGKLIEHTKALIKTGTQHASIVLGNARPPTR